MHFWSHEEFWIGVGSVLFFAGLAWYALPSVNRFLDDRGKGIVREFKKLDDVAAHSQCLVDYYDRYFRHGKIFEERARRAAHRKFHDLRTQTMAHQSNERHDRFLKMQENLHFIRYDLDRRIKNVSKRHVLALVSDYLKSHADQYYRGLSVEQYRHTIQKLLHKPR